MLFKQLIHCPLNIGSLGFQHRFKPLGFSSKLLTPFGQFWWLFCLYMRSRWQLCHSYYLTKGICRIPSIIRGILCSEMLKYDESSMPGWGTKIPQALWHGKKRSSPPYRAVCAQSCLTLCDPMNCSPWLLCPWSCFPDKNTGAGCHFLLERIFPTQG